MTRTSLRCALGTFACFLIFMAVPLQASAEAAKTPDAPAVQTAAPLAAYPSCDFFSSPFQTFKKQVAVATNTAAAQALADLKALISRFVEQAQAEEAEKKQARNVKGMVAARQAVELFQGLATQIDKDGTVTLPDTVRRENEAILQSFRVELEQTRATGSQKSTKTTADIHDRFWKLVFACAKDAARPDPDALGALFDAWMIAEQPVQGGTAIQVTVPKGQASAKGAGQAPSEQEFYAQSSKGAYWFTVGYFSTTVYGLDMINLPVFNWFKASVGQQQNRLTGRQTIWSCTPVVPLPMRGNYAFRLKKYGDLLPMDVIDWPSIKTDGRLSVRTPATTVMPSHCGFELQASLDGAEGKTLQTQALSGRSAEVIALPIETQPANAKIFINNYLYAQDGAEARTPAQVILPKGVYQIKLVLEDHLSKTMADFGVDQGRAIRWTFVHETNAPSKTFRVDAKGPWKTSRIAVTPSELYMITPSGSWACGDKGEMTDATGYDPKKFTQYTTTKGLRQLETANYGVLLMKTSADSKDFIVVDKPVKMGFRNAGELFFDINEKTDPASRRDNRGAIDVKVVSLPRSN